MKWYAIKVGLNAPCIVTSWDECERLVKGFSGAVFKAFNDPFKADEFLKAKLPKWANKPKNKYYGKRDKGALYGITRKTVRKTERIDTSEPLYSGELPPWE